MAQTTPASLPSKASQGEQRLFAVLKRLPDDVVVYYEPMIDNRNPDFVVLIPTLGVLLIEVKGWYLADIIAGDTHSVRVREGEREVERAHPLRQVADYKYRLMDDCAKDKRASLLVNSKGRYTGKVQFPFASFALLSNITRENLLKWPERSQAVFPPATVATRDQLIEWEGMNAPALLEVFKKYFDTFIAPMTRNQVNIVKAILHPEILLDLDLTNPAQPDEPTVKVLDLKQEELARDIGSGHRLIFGVAGSGKTVLLVSRAKLIARLNSKARVLVLCYNVAFASHLESLIGDLQNVSVSTFHSWAVRNGVKWNRDVDSQLGVTLRDKLLAGALDSRKFDTILIDEAQDFDPSWYGCVLAAMKDPVEGELLIVGDGNQGLYRRNKVSWKQLGVNAAGRTQYLYRNYRCTRPIVALAKQFAIASGGADEDTLTAPSVDPENCIRLRGAEAVLVTRLTKQEEVDRVVQIVEDLRNGRWFGEAISPLKSEQIGILYRMDPGLIGDLRNKLQASKHDCSALWLTENGKNAKNRIGEPGVKILTMHSSKGLQFKAVILLFAGDCPAEFPGAPEEEERRLFYVALTRAEDYLAVICSKLSTFTKAIHEAGSSAKEIPPAHTVTARNTFSV